MDHEEQLSWEQRVGRPVAIAAFASAVLFLVAFVYLRVSITDEANDTVDGLAVVSAHKADFLISTILQALATALLAVPLWFLYTVTRYRREELQGFARYLALGGPPLLGVALVIPQLLVTSVADRVTTALVNNPRAPEAANDFAKDELTEGPLQIIVSLGYAAKIAVAFAFIVISLNAMRAGVLSRFMGVLGIIVGALIVLPLLGDIPFVQIFWVAALGVLFLGFWPQGGRGPAWETGEPIPWPTMQDRQEALVTARAGADGGDAAPEPDFAGEPEPVRQHASHPRSKKRKRKRR